MSYLLRYLGRGFHPLSITRRPAEGPPYGVMRYLVMSDQRELLVTRVRGAILSIDDAVESRRRGATSGVTAPLLCQYKREDLSLPLSFVG